MKNNNINIESYTAISNALEIPETEDEGFDETAMIINIERRVAELMEREMGLLMSYLYRLDIKEYKIKACLDPASAFHPYTCLATLIWERQKQRIQSKLDYIQDAEIDEEWKW